MVSFQVWPSPNYGRLIGSVDFVFCSFNWLIIGLSLIGMVTMTLSGLDSRTRGVNHSKSGWSDACTSRRWFLIETILISIISMLMAVGLVRLSTGIAADLLTRWAGVRIELTWISLAEFSVLMIIILAGLIASLLPATLVYRRSLAPRIFTLQ